ncbi:MAG: ABC transporter permease [Firmicutes bacterium]|jgi:peptide/nickel transport system permease protein|nr:ABC transporter permease [Bacillota bacterium]
MGAYALKRILQLIPVLLAVTIVVFTVMKVIPGDPARMLAGELAPLEQVEAIRKELFLDKPIIVQYWHYLSGLLRGDLGYSYRSKRPVSEEIAARYPNTVKLALVSICIAIVLGIGTGILSATKQGSWFDTVSRLVSMLGVTVPTFWLGLMLMLIFAVRLGLLPTMYTGSPKDIILPAFTLGLNSTTFIARMTRSCMLEVLRQDYVRTARAKGISERIVVLKHALRNALPNVVTVVGLQMGSLLGGAIIVESVFAWPGIGLMMVEAVAFRDHPVVCGTVLVAASALVIVNLIVDLLYAVLDPRISYR